MNNSIEENDVIEIDIREIAGMFFSKLRLIISVGLFSALLMFNFSKFLGSLSIVGVGFFESRPITIFRSIFIFIYDRKEIVHHKNSSR